MATDTAMSLDHRLGPLGLDMTRQSANKAMLTDSEDWAALGVE